LPPLTPFVTRWIWVQWAQPPRSQNISPGRVLIGPDCSAGYYFMSEDRGAIKELEVNNFFAASRKNSKEYGIIATDNFKIERDNFSIVKDNFKIETDNFRITTDSFFRSIENLNDHSSFRTDGEHCFQCSNRKG
jgi:hypothetical protein